MRTFDLAVIGGGILGLAHAFAAARLGKRVVVIEREARANGASIRNFGFVTITGQARGDTWRRAMRSRDIWADVAPRAGIDIHQRGLILCARFAESLPVIDAFLATEMGAECRFLSPRELSARALDLGGGDLKGALWSPHELRVDSPSAIPRLAAWLEAEMGVAFQYGTAALDLAPPRITTSRGPVMAAAAVVCPGDDFVSLFPEVIGARGLEKSTLTMLRLADPGRRLPATVMSDLGLVRYLGYAALPAAAPLRARLEASHRDALAHGVHLIVAQGADGGLIVGDSHHYGDRADPFMETRVEELILREFQDALGFAPPPVVARWMGSYAHTPDAPMFVETPRPDVRLVMVTSGTGASTSFAIAEEVVGELYGVNLLDTPLGRVGPTPRRSPPGCDR